MRLFDYIAKRLWIKSSQKHAISAPVVKIAVTSVALGVAVMILTAGIVTGFKAEIRKRATGFAGHICINAYTNNNSFEQEPVNTDAPFLEKLKSNSAILHIQPYATKSAIIKTAFENQGIVIKGVSSEYKWDFIKQYLTEGRLPDYSDTSVSSQILISKPIALKLAIKPGDKLLTYFVGRKTAGDSVGGYEQRVRKFTVCGVYQTGFSDVDNNIVFADLRQVQKLNYWNQKQAGGFELELKDFLTLDELTEEVNEEVGQGLEAKSIKTLYPTLFSWLDLLDSNAAIIIGLMIAVAVINMISALLILILERSNTIGILKALGADNGLVQKVFLFQSGRILARGLIIGNLVGLALLFTQLILRPVSLNPDTYYVSFVPVEFNLWHVLGLNLLTLLVCFIMMALPVLVVSRITPVKSIKFK